MKLPRPSGTCCRCGKRVIDGDWIQFSEYCKVLGRHALLHYCRYCWTVQAIKMKRK